MYFGFVGLLIKHDKSPPLESHHSLLCGEMCISTRPRLPEYLNCSIYKL